MHVKNLEELSHSRSWLPGDLDTLNAALQQIHRQLLDTERENAAKLSHMLETHASASEAKDEAYEQMQVHYQRAARESEAQHRTQAREKEKAHEAQLNILRTQLDEQSAKHATQKRSLKATIAQLTTEKEEGERLRDKLLASMAQARKLDVGQR